MFSRTWANWASAVVVLSLLASGVLAEPPAESISDNEGRIAFETLARTAQSITEAVLAHHVDPPTRQEMWLAGTKAMLAKAGVVHHAALSSEISQLTTAESSSAVLSDKRSLHEGNGTRFQKAEVGVCTTSRPFIDVMLWIHSWAATFVSQKEQIVQEQFQGNRYIGTGIEPQHHDAEQKYPRLAW